MLQKYINSQNTGMMTLGKEEKKNPELVVGVE
jgi:hypothetical protein